MANFSLKWGWGREKDAERKRDNRGRGTLYAPRGRDVTKNYNGREKKNQNEGILRALERA